MLRFAIVISSAVFLAGCVNAIENLRQSSLADVRSYGRNLEVFLNTEGTSEQALDLAKKAVVERMKDPESVRFRNVSIKTFEGKPIICGEVNGKNSYGGYVGFQRFVASYSEASIYEDDSRYSDVNSAANAGINAACPR